jgi:hypothetical protein
MRPRPQARSPRFSVSSSRDRSSLSKTSITIRPISRLPSGPQPRRRQQHLRAQLLLHAVGQKLQVLRPLVVADFCSAAGFLASASFFRGSGPRPAAPPPASPARAPTRPCATTRAASRSRLLRLHAQQHLRVPGRDSAPSESARLIASDRSSNRSAFATVARALPIRFEIVLLRQPGLPHQVAVALGFLDQVQDPPAAGSRSAPAPAPPDRSPRAAAPESPATPPPAPPGTAARRRSARKSPPPGRNHTGSSTPFARMESASSFSASSAKPPRGCHGPFWIWCTGIMMDRALGRRRRGRRGLSEPPPMPPSRRRLRRGSRDASRLPESAHPAPGPSPCVSVVLT